MKSSAVEFIVEQLAKNGVLHSSDIDKAKEMEKEQTIEFASYYTPFTKEELEIGFNHKFKQPTMKIISLYPSNDAYQVVDEEDQSVYYQGSQADCEKFIRYEQLRAKAQSKLYHQTILQRNL